MSPICPLCSSQGLEFYLSPKKTFYICPICKGIFQDSTSFLPAHKEKERYLLHENNPENTQYQSFVSPIVEIILQKFTPSHKGLDFGSGSGSAISKLLNDVSYQIQQYDPYFANYPELLTKTYDYIACCEVIEHFYNPLKEFKLLKKLLNPNALLVCMTDIYNDSIDFEKWYYKNDPTHVFIYQIETIRWIQKKLKFKNFEIIDRLIYFY